MLLKEQAPVYFFYKPNKQVIFFSPASFLEVAQLSKLPFPRKKKSPWAVTQVWRI